MILLDILPLVWLGICDSILHSIYIVKLDNQALSIMIYWLGISIMKSDVGVIILYSIHVWSCEQNNNNIMPVSVCACLKCVFSGVHSLTHYPLLLPIQTGSYCVWQCSSPPPSTSLWLLLTGGHGSGTSSSSLLHPPFSSESSLWNQLSSTGLWLTSWR